MSRLLASCLDALIAAFMLLLSVGCAHAAPAPTACQDQFYKQQMPDWAPTGVMTANRSHALCFSEFGVLQSGLTLTPIWSAEHLTANRVTSAKALKRENKFHSEKNIPPEDRATLTDYRGSHYDRGHMSPDDDMGDMQAQFESFSLANMVPQNPCNNEIIWKAIETSVRDYVIAHGDVYVVTGPIFDNANTIGNGVHVPSRLFKAVYDPRLNQMVIVVTPNENVQSYTTATPDQLRTWTGVSPFPAVSGTTALTLPSLPHLSGSCKKEEN